jgi:hypothetical protein
MPDANLIVTALLGGAGIAGTLTAPLLSARRAKQEALRQERLKLYADALAHGVSVERSLNATWMSDGAKAYDLSPKPAGGPMSLTPMDAITVRMRLVADETVEKAWAELIAAWSGWQWWGDNEWNGDLEENPPDDVVSPLRAAVAELTRACKRSIQ